VSFHTDFNKSVIWHSVVQKTPNQIQTTTKQSHFKVSLSF